MTSRKLLNHRTAYVIAFAFVLVACTLVSSSQAVAQGEPFLELLRKDVQSEKVLLMTAALELTDEQGELFWPIYREYQLELSKLGDRRIKLIKDYAANYDAMTEEKAKELSKISFDLQDKQLSLLKKTHKNASKAVGPLMATRFVQVENQLLLLINLQIASEMPLIK